MTAPRSSHCRPASLVLDIGGTKIGYGIVTDDDPLTILAPGRIPAQPQGGSIHEQVRLAVDEGLRAAGDLEAVEVVRVGIGAPGVVEAPRGRVLRAGDTIPGWAGTDITAIVGEHTSAPVACTNDVRIWAFGEHHVGVGAGFPKSARVLYVSLGTGVGGAIITPGGQLAEGPTSSAGEISELIAPDCRGIADRVENIAAGPSLARYYHTLREHPEHRDPIGWEDPQLCPIELPEILRRAEAGEDLARFVLNGNLRGLGRMLGAIISAADLSGVVLGGGVGTLGAVVLDPITDGVRSACLPLHRDVPILVSRLGPTAPLVAAAAYARSVASSLPPRG